MAVYLPHVMAGSSCLGPLVTQIPTPETFRPIFERDLIGIADQRESAFPYLIVQYAMRVRTAPTLPYSILTVSTAVVYLILYLIIESVFNMNNRGDTHTIY